MIIPIISTSALEFWLYNAATCTSKQYSLNGRKLVTLPAQYHLELCNDDIAGIAEEYNISLPVQIMAMNRNSRRSYINYSCSSRPSYLPNNTFLKLDNVVWISSPELCFLQIVSQYSIPELVRIANDFCSTYAANPNAEYLQITREPVTNVASIKRLLKRIKSCPGRAKAIRALRYAVDNSHSPKESDLAVLLLLPLYLGGYGLTRPQMNLNIRLCEKAEALLRRRECCCDMVWEKQRVILEYDSNLAHLNAEQHAYDKGKYSALTMSGYKVLAVTARHVQNFRTIEDLYENVRISLKIKRRSQAMEKYFDQRWQTVHLIMFSGKKRM